MSLSEKLLKHFEEIIRSKTGTQRTIISFEPVTGGDINRAFRLFTKSDSFFVKLNNAAFEPDMFSAESKGLQTLGVSTPGVLDFGVFGHDSFLIMEWIERAENSKKGQENLGRLLAGIHRKNTKNFGLPYNNFIGSLKQFNTTDTNWTQFYSRQRLEKQLDLASQKHLIDTTIRQQFEKLYLKLDTLYEPEKPALLHGDLWSGNYIISKDSQPFLIDPAIYYGHREMDIAMSKLFGGFEPAFYNAYHENFPLAPGWERRLSLWQLYPLLVHLNLFGKSYLPGIQANLKNWL